MAADEENGRLLAKTLRAWRGVTPPARDSAAAAALLPLGARAERAAAVPAAPPRTTVEDEFRPPF